ncbi:hypothetical protein [Viridibacillus arvi]|uniref:hypothetical protein n=1 Tax=Viridibacillus arvi TaxID=263475 RepID=UPI0034D004BB
MNYVTIGVYSNDTFKVNIVRPEHIEGHIEYNKTMRFGRALFVNGKCEYSGYLSDEKVAKWTEKIAEMTFDTSKPSVLYW